MGSFTLSAGALASMKAAAMAGIIAVALFVDIAHDPYYGPMYWPELQMPSFKTLW